MSNKTQQEMKKLLYAVMLLLSLSIFTVSCENGTSSYSIGNSSSSSNPQHEEEVDPYELYSDWSECIDLQIQEIQVGMMTGPGIVVENICEHKIKQVKIVAQTGYYSENYNFYDLQPGEVKTKPLQLPDATITDIKIEF